MEFARERKGLEYGTRFASLTIPMIRANCRERFTAADFDFVVKSLARSERDSVTLVDLLTDASARDAILDHPCLFQTIMEHGAPLHISPQFYFYILIRHVLKE